ncbi:hypothetical protein [Natrialba taiwanensis]|nr:hypothetical protein [Natrialba taiwanensis]
MEFFEESRDMLFEELQVDITSSSLVVIPVTGRNLSRPEAEQVLSDR